MKLEEWEVICPQCKGEGKTYTEGIDYDGFEHTFEDVCNKCNGFGKLDWLENIFGKKRKFIIVWNSVPAGFNRGQLNVITSKGIKKIRNKK